MDYTTLEKIVRENEKESRFEHSLGVVEVATRLARRFNLDVELCRMAAIFHDYARYMDGPSMLTFCRMRNIRMWEEEVENPMLLHGPVASWYFPRITNIKDDRPVKAIRNHTLGSQDMGKMGAIVYIGDYSEKGRRHLTDADRKDIWGHDTLEEMVLDIMLREEEYCHTVDRKLAKVTADCIAWLKEGGCFED